MPDPTPEQDEHPALQYLRAGFSVIPLDPNSKQPSERWLHSKWRPYQSVRASEHLMAQWLSDDSLNWGVVCGQVSGGLYCGDIDVLAFAQWVLDDPNRSIFQGACIVRSGSGKAHIWFVSPNQILSTNWKLGDGHVGQIRGDGRPGTGGSYMVVPPSIHPDTGQRYEVVTGSLLHLPVITDGKKFLTDILRAYKGDPTVQYVESDPKHTSKAILSLTDEEKQRAISRVRALRLKKRIADTLLIAGCQDPTSPTWERALTQSQMSHSEIDFAVVCALIEKGQSFEEVEEIFAATLVGDACYANKDRPNHGGAYLWQTFGNAQRDIEKKRQSQRVAVGNNFRVEHVTKVDHGVAYTFKIDLTYIDRRDGTERPVEGIELSTAELQNEGLFHKKVFDDHLVSLDFAAAHQGKEFRKLAQSIVDMASETEIAAETSTALGLLAERLRQQLRQLSPRIPLKKGEVRGYGWDNADGTFTVLAVPFMTTMQSMHHGLKDGQIPQVMRALGDWQATRHLWPDGTFDRVYRFIPKSGP